MHAEKEVDRSMDTKLLGSHGRAVQLIVGTGSRDDVVKAVDTLAEEEQWDLCGFLLPSAAELGARLLVAKLIELKQYAPLAFAACVRRQVKVTQQTLRPGQTSRRVFRDIDTETEEKAIPEHIKAEMDDLASQADEARYIADRREAERDSCPVRALIVNELGKIMTGNAGAINALIAVVRAAAYEDTKRSAALKLLTNESVLPKLAEASRIDDMVYIANACGLDSASEKVATILAPKMDELIDAKKRMALRLIGRFHSEQGVRDRANVALR